MDTITTLDMDFIYRHNFYIMGKDMHVPGKTNLILQFIGNFPTNLLMITANTIPELLLPIDVCLMIAHFKWITTS